MKHPASIHTHRRLGCLAAVLAVAGLMPRTARAEAPLLPDLPPAAPIPPAPPPTGPLPVEAVKPIEAELGMRLGARVQNPNEPDRLDDMAAAGRVEVQLLGSINSGLKWQASFIGTFGLGDQDGRIEDRPSAIEGKAAVLDLIARLELHEACKLWIGRLLVPADRAGLSTVWFMTPWLFPGQFTSTLPPVGARQGELGRSEGATFWGDLYGGTFKYYVGAYNLADPELAPLYSGRLSLSLLSPEPGYRTASSTYGNRDLLTIGVGLQHQVDGSTHVVRTERLTDEVAAWDNFTQLNVDVLFEKDLGGAGVLNMEGAFYKIWGQYEPKIWTAFGLVSYLLPIEVGWGRFQPMFRLQRASPRGKEGTDTLADAQLGYIIDGARARAIVGYQYSKVSGQSANALFFGLQLLTR